MKNVYIIAEIGNNHNGSKHKAFELINAAAAAGVDAVKFQSFRGIDIVSTKVKVEEYPQWNVKGYEYWYEFLDSIALKLEEHQEVIDYALTQKLDFITTPVSPSVVEILEEMKGIKAYKIASMDLDNIPLLEAIAATHKPVIVSTGMGGLDEIRRAVEIFKGRDLSLLHCISDYPVNLQEAGLCNILQLKAEFPGLIIGFSDHSIGWELPIAAVCLGSMVIEKHITLDRNDPSPAEHHFAMEPNELRQMVKWIRSIENNLHYDGFFRSKGEEENRKRYRRSYHYTKNFAAGDKIGQEDLLFIRPADGIRAYELNMVKGRLLKKAVNAYDPCMISDFE